MTRTEKTWWKSRDTNSRKRKGFVDGPMRLQTCLSTAIYCSCSKAPVRGFSPNCPIPCAAAPKEGLAADDRRFYDGSAWTHRVSLGLASAAPSGLIADAASLQSITIDTHCYPAPGLRSMLMPLLACTAQHNFPAV